MSINAELWVIYCAFFRPTELTRRHQTHTQCIPKYFQNIYKIFKMCHLSIRDPAERWKRNERSTSWWHQRYILIRDEKGTFGGHLFSKISSRAIRYTPTSKSKYLSLIVELICPRVYHEELKFLYPHYFKFSWNSMFTIVKVSDKPIPRPSLVNFLFSKIPFTSLLLLLNWYWG